MPHKPEKPTSDVVLLGPPTADGAGVHVLRARKDRVEAGEMRPVKEGAPLSQGTEIVTLTPRPGAPHVCDVEASFPVPSAPSAGAGAAATSPARAKGPARVASPSYRQGWDEVFGKAPTRAATDKTLN